MKQKNEQTSGYDIIGDIHGHCDELECLLQKMDYFHDGNSYTHPDGRKAIFVGDLIDRGPKVRQTLELVRAMHEQQQALVVIGNHEYNAVGYCTPHPDDPDRPLRELSPASLAQYQSTCAEFTGDRADEWMDYIDWFRSLPLFMDLGGFRVVHACWSQRYIDLVGDRTLADDSFLTQSVSPGREEDAIEILLKGPELKLPPGESVTDKHGTRRTSVRVKWWQNLEAQTYRSISFPDRPHLPDKMIDVNRRKAGWDVYPADAPPVFVGHYSLPPDSPTIYGNVVCLDYSVTNGGFTAAYRWDGESELSADNFVSPV